MNRHHRSFFVLLTAYCLLLTAVMGCESLQKKFTRKPKTQPHPSPIIVFEDYTRAMTPLDRYRKHYLLFDYWNAQLLDELTPNTTNPKRIRQASAEALKELQVLQGFLQDDVASGVARLLEERGRLDQEIQHESYTPSQLDVIRRLLEIQTRQIHRELFWRKVEDRLK